MGYEQAQNMRVLSAHNFSAAWWPGKEHQEIPGNLMSPAEPIGSPDCDHVIWFQGAIRKMFGFDNVNTTVLESAATITGLIDMTSQSNNLIGTIGTKLYRNLHAAVPVDITGALTITAGTRFDFQEYRIGSTTMVIGVNGTDAPLKWEGSGNGAVLAGSPPTGTYIEYFNNYIFLANTSTNPERVYFSGLSAPESWDTTNDFFTFDDSITGIKVFGKQLVVFKRNSIGILSGFGVSSWSKIDQYVVGIGCVGNQTIINARIGGDLQRDVLVFLSSDGLYAYDGSPNVIKLSHPIQNKFISSTSTSRFNENRFSSACAVFWERYNWYMLSLSDGGDSTNDFLLIADLARPLRSPEGIFSVPFWPVDGIDANVIATRQTSGLEEVFFGGTDGFMYKFDPAIFNENGTAITGRFTSKIFDIQNTWILRETNLLGDEIGNVNVTTSINADLQEGLGENDTVNFADEGDLLDTTFIIGTSTLGGVDFVYKTADINHFGRFLQFDIRQATLDQRMIIEQIDFVVKDAGLRPNQGM